MPPYYRLKTLLYHRIKTGFRWSYTSVGLQLTRAYSGLRISFKPWPYKRAYLCDIRELIRSYTTTNIDLYHTYTKAYTRLRIVQYVRLARQPYMEVGECHYSQLRAPFQSMMSLTILIHYYIYIIAINGKKWLTIHKCKFSLKKITMSTKKMKSNLQRKIESECERERVRECVCMCQ